MLAGLLADQMAGQAACCLIACMCRGCCLQRVALLPPAESSGHSEAGDYLALNLPAMRAIVACAEQRCLCPPS